MACECQEEDCDDRSRVVGGRERVVRKSGGCSEGVEGDCEVTMRVDGSFGFRVTKRLGIVRIS
jgi:hypothetical protein